jgi:hypothetical protein
MALPLVRRLGSEDPQRRPRHEMALKVEIIVDGSMHAEEALGESSGMGMFRHRIRPTLPSSSRRPTSSPAVRFATDSLVEEGGFEPSVPLGLE